MLFGKYPFDGIIDPNQLGQKDSDIMDKIVKEDHKFPTDIVVSSVCYKLLNGLLNKNVKHRLDMNDPLFEEWYSDPNGSDAPVINPHKSNTHHVDLNIHIPFDSPKKTNEKKSFIKTPTTFTQSKLSSNVTKLRSNSITNSTIGKAISTLPLGQRGSSKFIITKK
jgi:serine/threonine protein kinase